ncbi:MAG: response regulator transcription factor, partial [Endomicrobiia bacterium]|nr:response regulator transcription factor [Endomicrobiia bacterium]
SGYLVKSSPSEYLIKSVRLVHDGEVVLPRELTAKLVNAVHKNQPRILSPRETEVLKLIAQGLSNKAIAKRLASSSSTVKNQISSVFAKLKVQSRSAAVSEAAKKGLI